MSDRTHCDAAAPPVRLDGQTEQSPRCQAPAGHDGDHRAVILDTDDNPIPHHWR